jgi:hypothetical protein
MSTATLSRTAAMAILAIITAAVLLPAGETSTILSKGALSDHNLDADPESSFWRPVPALAVDHDKMGNPVKTASMQIRSRWTDRNLYLLFTCAYHSLYLKPNPDTAAETNELWNWDVAEAFIGDDFANINRYKEFEVSPHGEWVDLDIDRNRSGGSPDAWLWNSGFKVKSRIDEAAKIWYAEMRIPLSSISRKPAAPGLQLRINFFHSEGDAANRLTLVWRPTHSATFHVPAAFGIIQFAPPPAS